MLDLACNYRKPNGRATAMRGRALGRVFYAPGSCGQLSLIQRVRLSSLTSPAARERMMAAASASGFF